MAAGNHEFSYIEWIRRQVAVNDRTMLGIGDDAASFRFPAAADLLLATDMLLEGVHFTFPELTPADVGRKALAVNLSDIAAMAGNPLGCLVSVALPRQSSRRIGEEVHHGLQQLAEEFAVDVLGGDTNVWDGPLVINVAVIGEATSRGIVKRGGAQVGDWIFVTGPLGGSLFGKHYQFQPRVAEALRLHAQVDLHAMIDVSDGLAADLGHILTESGVGAVVYEESVPVSEAAHRWEDGRSAFSHAISDGEDFELLLTVSAEDGERLLAAAPADSPLYHIGEITAGSESILRRGDGTAVPFEPAGWEHQFGE